MNGNNASGLTSITGVLLVWATLIFGVRIWVKTRLRTVDFWGYDDTTVSLSFVLVIAQVAAVFHAVNLGYGDPWSALSETTINNIQQSLYAGQILYVCGMGCIRLSTCLFTARLSRHRRHRNAGQLWTAACLTITAASVLVIAIRGDLSRPWATLDGTETMYYRWLGFEIVGLVLDICVFATASALVWGLHMPVTKRLMVSSVFLTRLLVIPFIILRLHHLHPSNNPSASLLPTATSPPSQLPPIFTSASLHIAFILALVTCLKPFLRPFHEGHLITGAGGSGSTKISGYLKPHSHNGVATLISSGGGGNGTGRHQLRASEYMMLKTAKDTTTTTTTTSSHASPGIQDGKPAAITSATEDSLPHNTAAAAAAAAGASLSTLPRAFVPDTHGSHRSTVVTIPSHGHGHAHMQPHERERERDRDRERKRHGSSDSEQMFISKTQTWTVEYQERSGAGASHHLNEGRSRREEEGEQREEEEEREEREERVRPHTPGERSSSSLDVGRVH